MPQHLTIGGRDDGDGADRALVLPTLPDLPAVARVEDALDDACVRRLGLLVVGPKGVGKSYGTKLALAGFDQAERARQALDDGYRRWQVLPVHGLYTTRYRDALLDLLFLVTGVEHRRRVHGQPVTENALLERLVLHCQEDRIAALVVDEAERLAPAVLTLLRDLMAKSVALDPAQADVDGSRALGVGVLLVGAPPARALVAATSEQGHRWARTVAVGGVAPEAVAGVYETWFPGFRAGIAERGRRWWEAQVDGLVTAGQTVAVRSLDQHARLYWRYLVRDDATLTAREDAPLRPEVFAYAASQVEWQRSAAADDDAAAAGGADHEGDDDA